MADNIQSFIKELAFEEALTQHLLGHGWNEVIMNPTEEELVQNWANIIYDNNREIDKLGNYPLTTSEMFIALRHEPLYQCTGGKHQA